jgi:hypothetical protein
MNREGFGRSGRGLIDVVPRQYLVETEENQDSPSPDSRCTGRVSTRAPHEYAKSIQLEDLAWLYTLLHNVILNYFRGSRVHLIFKSKTKL